MSEKLLKTSVVALIRRDFQDAWFYKASDRWHSGIPDIVGCVRGRFFAIELKSERGRVSRIQSFTLAGIETAGGQTAVCRTLGEVRVFLENIMEG